VRMPLGKTFFAKRFGMVADLCVPKTSSMLI
jgi:hypothetical protein